MNIDKKISLWRDNGLITDAQSAAILRFEKKHHKPYFLFGFLALAAFCIGLGIISLIAANWAFIPPAFKLGASFSLMAACGAATLSAYIKNKPNTFETLLFLFSILIMAQIGLIGQIYQLPPDDAAVCLFWSALVFPLIVFSRKGLLPILWLPILTCGVFLLIDDTPSLQAFFSKIKPFWTFSIAVVWVGLHAVVYQILTRYGNHRLSGLRTGLKFWLTAAFAFLIVVMDFGRWSHDLQFILTHIRPQACMAVCALLFAIITVISFRLKNYILPAFFLLIWIGSLFSCGFILSLTALLLLAVHAYIHYMPRLASASVFLIGVRLFIWYTETIYSLMNTGIALIVTGILLLGLIFASLKLSKFIKGKLYYEN